MASWSRPLCAMLALALAAPAAAQTYRQDEVDGSLRMQRQIAIRYAKKSVLEPDERRQLEEYFEKYHLPAMTQSSPAGLAGLEKLRVDLFKQFIGESSGPTQRYLSETAKEFAKTKMINPRANYHPAVVYNGLLVLGRIDKVYATDGAAPTPDDENNRLLCAIAKRASEDANVPNYFLAGALIGLERHTRYLASLPQPNQTLTQKTLRDLLVKDDLAGSYDVGVRDWFYLKAARGLANLATVGPNGAFFKAIGKRMADESLDTETRVELAGMLAKLNASKGQVEAGPTGDAFLKLVVPVAEAEIEIAEKFEDMQIRGGRARPIGGGRDKTARRFRLEEDGIVLVRGGLLKTLTDLHGGAKTLAELAEGDAAARFAAIAEALRPAIVATRDDKDTIDLTVAGAVKQAMRTASNAAKGEAEPAAVFQ